MKDREEESKILAIRNEELEKELEAVKVDDAYIFPTVQYHHHMHVFMCVCNSSCASVSKLHLVHISCLIQCSGACSRHMGAEFVRGTVENLVVGGKMLLSVLTKFSLRMWTEFV